MSDPRPIPAAAPWAEDLCSVGITGTNGKTSTTTMLASTILAAGRRVYTATTLEYALDLRPLAVASSWGGFVEGAALARAVGVRHAAIEVTSQGLARGHAKRWRFDHGVFTNLSPDHLKSHGSWEHYLASKAQLFVHLSPGGTAVLNARDPCSALIDQVTPADVQRRWFGALGRGPSVRAEDLSTVGLGEMQHIAPNDTPEQREQNRRVTMQFLEVSRLPPAEELTLRGITFRSGSATLTPADKLIVDSVVGYVQSRPSYAIQVQGHTDDRGSDELNQKLSESRAKAVADYLVSKGVDGARLSSAGFGESRPIAANETDAGRAQNRRVTLKFSAR